MRDHPAILLMGLRGSGKSTLGPMLADRVGRPFLDLDHRTACALHERFTTASEATISDLFRVCGEPAFREAEAEALREALSVGPPRPVVALGGGTPTAPGAADLIRQNTSDGAAVVVYLRLNAASLAQRLRRADNADRPALVGSDPISEVAQVLAARDRLYLELASSTLDLDDLSIDQAFGALLDALHRLGIEVQ